MTDETKRPRMEGGIGSRARNRTLVMSAESVDSVRDSGDSFDLVDAETEASENSAVESLGFSQAVGGDGYLSPLAQEDETLRTLDEIFGGVSERRHSSVLSDVAGYSDVPSGGQIESDDIAGGVVREQSYAAGGDDLDAEAEETPSFQDDSARPEPMPSRRILRPSQILSSAHPSLAALHGQSGDAGDMQQRNMAEQSEELRSPYEEAPPVFGGSYVEAPRIVRGVSSSESVPPSFAGRMEERQVDDEVGFSEERSMESAGIDQIFWKADSTLVGFLVSYDHDPKGTYVELRTGRLIVSNQRESSSNCLVVNDRSVSPMHAIMRVAAGGVIQVLDQLSESGTRVRRQGQGGEEFLSGEKTSLSQGDVVFFGDRKFHVLLVVGEEG